MITSFWNSPKTIYPKIMINPRVVESGVRTFIFKPF